VAAFIAAQRENHGIAHATACRALGVSPSWCYKWRAGVLPPRAARWERLKAEIIRLFRAHEGKYGAPRITADLRDAGWRVSENTVAALMREQGLAARRRRGRRSTEIPTGEGTLYLASVLDVGSRRVVGFALSEHHDAALAYGALAMAVAVRGGQVPGVIMHTDCGREYTAGLFRAACGRLQIRQSMGRPGSALDNAVIEAWHSTLTFELRSRETFATKKQARARVPAWIDDYNRQRRHSACGMLSPIDYELAQTHPQVA
jgi:putative transposase